MNKQTNKLVLACVLVAAGISMTTQVSATWYDNYLPSRQTVKRVALGAVVAAGVAGLAYNEIYQGACVRHFAKLAYNNPQKAKALLKKCAQSNCASLRALAKKNFASLCVLAKKNYASLRVRAKKNMLSYWKYVTGSASTAAASTIPAVAANVVSDVPVDAPVVESAANTVPNASSVVASL